MSNEKTRRTFLKTAAVGTAVSMTAASYARVPGANDRIRIGVIGCGGRGRHAHMTGIQPHAKDQNAEIVAVCDPWRQRREEAAETCKKWFGKRAKDYVSYRDMLADDQVDAVMIASCDHHHTTHLEAVAKAKKDVYCEKPLAMDMESLKRACDAAEAAGIVVQIGTQLRSLPSMTGVRKLYQTGILGKVARIEQNRNGSEPYWYSRLEPLDPKDTDWDEFLMDRPKEPFSAERYTGWYGYLSFTDGPVTNLGCHYLDLVHYITGATFPNSAVCLGGVYTWKDEHNFDCPDHVQALWDYPEGFMVSYTTNFGNSAAKSFKILGDQGMLDLENWSDPKLSADGGSKNKGIIRGVNDVEPVDMPDHFLDWLQCIRSRKLCNAPLSAGYQHAVAGTMAVMAWKTGKRMIYDREKREIREG